MSSDDFELLVEPGYIPGGQSTGSLRVASGRLAACANMQDGVAGSGIGGEGAPAVAWGGADDADYPRVTGWVAVTDMDGKGGTLVPGFLQAAWWGGRLWLRYSKELSGGGGDAEAEEDAEAVYGAAGTMVDGVLRTREHERGPALLVVPMSERESWLKRDGQWRADVPWEVMALYGVHPSGAWYRWDEEDDTAYMEPEVRVTIWMVPIGRAICFMTTSSDKYYFSEKLAYLEPVAQRLKYSEFGRDYDATVDELTEKGPHMAFEAALLPWEAEKCEPWTGVSEADGWSLGSEADSMCCARFADGVPMQRRAAYYRPVSVCSRFHDSSSCGMYQATTGFTVLPGDPEAEFEDRLKDILGAPVESWLDALEYAMTKGLLGGDMVSLYETAQDYRFDPDSVEGLGLSAGYAAGYWVRSAEQWPPIAEPYRVTLRAEVETIGARPLYIVMAGTEVDNVLLTASMFAEDVIYCEGADIRDIPSGGGESFDSSGNWGPKEEDDDDDWVGPGPRPGPGDDEDPDDDDDPDTKIAVQIGYEKGDGVGFKQCSLVRRKGQLFWKLVLDGAFVMSALRRIPVPGSLTLKANGAQAGTSGRVVEMGLNRDGGNSASASGKQVNGTAALVFHGTNDVDAKMKELVCPFNYMVDLDVDVPDQVWYLSTTELSEPGSWVRRVRSNGQSCFDAKASEWYTFSVDADALRRAAADELARRMKARRVFAQAVSQSYDSVVRATLTGNVLAATAEAILS